MDGGAALAVGWIGGVLGRGVYPTGVRTNDCGIGGIGVEATGNSTSWDASCSRESRAGTK